MSVNPTPIALNRETTYPISTLPIKKRPIESPPAPVAKKIRVEHTAHGDKRVDEYHWLKNKEDPETISFLKSWNDYTKERMQPLEPLAKRLCNEFFRREEPNTTSAPFPLGEYLYYDRMLEGEEHPIYCRKQEGKNVEEVILNVNTYAKERNLDFIDVCEMEPSPNGRYIAFSLDTDGSQFGKIAILDMTTKEFLPETFGVNGGNLVWNSTSDGLWYSHANESFRSHQIRFHLLGNDPVDDLTILEETNPLFDLYVETDKSHQWLIITSKSKDSSEVKMGQLSGPSTTLMTIHPREEGLKYDIIPKENELFILMSTQRSNWSLWKTSLSHPSREHWKEVIPQSSTCDLEDVQVFQDHLAILKREEGLKKIEIWNLKHNTKHQIPLPQEVGDPDFEHNEMYATPYLRFTFDSPVMPLTTYRYHMDTGVQEVLKQKKAGDFDPSLYTSERIWAQADDGTRIPISLCYKKGSPRDGKMPTYLYGYGAYGITFDPYFSKIKASLLERGVCYAIAHVRGGGYLGRQWYEQGCMMNKKKSFSDFINCAEHLIRQGYTSPNHLVISGGSAGGLLVGTILNQRPDHFKACVAEVPFVDVVTSLFDESIPLTTQEWKEWGNPNHEEEYHYLKDYSPIDNVKAQNYPALYVTAGINDKQVSYHEPAKWVAKLREFKTDQNPLLFQTIMESGHQGASGRYARLEEAAPLYAFLLDQLGFKE